MHVYCINLNLTLTNSAPHTCPSSTYSLTGLWYCHTGWSACPANGMHLSFMQDNNNIWLNTPPVTPNVWTTVRIVIDNTNLRMTMQVTGGLAYSNSIAFPQVAMNTGFQAVAVYAGDPWHQQTPAGLVRNFQIWQLGTVEPSLVAPQLPTRSPTRWPTRRPVRVVTNPPQTQEIINRTPAPVRRRRRGRPSRRPSIRPTTDDNIGNPTRSPTVRCPPSWRPWRGGVAGPVRACAAPRGRNVCPVTWFRLIAASKVTGVVCTPTRPVTPLPSAAPTRIPTGSPLRPGQTANPTTFRPTRRPFRPGTLAPASSVGCFSKAWMRTTDGFCQARRASMRRCSVGWSAVRPSTGSRGVTCRRVGRASRSPSRPRATCPPGFASAPFSLCMASSAATTKCPARGFATRVTPPPGYRTTGILCSRLPACPAGFAPYSIAGTSGCVGMVSTLTTCPATANSPWFRINSATTTLGVRCGLCATGFSRMSMTVCQATSLRTRVCSARWRRVSRATTRRGIRCAFGPRGPAGSRSPSRPRGSRAPSRPRGSRAPSRRRRPRSPSRRRGSRSPSRRRRPRVRTSPPQNGSNRCFRTIAGVWTEVNCPPSSPSSPKSRMCTAVVQGVPLKVPCRFTRMPQSRVRMCPALIRSSTGALVKTQVPCSSTRKPRPSRPSRRRPRRPSRPSRRRTRRPVRTSVVPPNGGLGSGIFFCPATWTRMLSWQSNRCRAPVGINGPCPAGMIRTSVGTSARGVTCGSSLAITTQTGCPWFWRRLSGGRCKAPVGGDVCPPRWRTLSRPSRRSGVLCGRPRSVSSAPARSRRSRGPVRPTRRRCPPRWVPARISGSTGVAGQCRAPVGTTRCPLRWVATQRASPLLGVTCARMACPAVAAGSPAWTAVGNTQCIAPPGIIDCPLGWWKAASATPTAGVLCGLGLRNAAPTRRPTSSSPRPTVGRLTMPCSICPSRWIRLPSGQCRGPVGVQRRRCPAKMSLVRAGGPARGITCACNFSSPRPSRAPTVGPSRRPTARPSARPTVTPPTAVPTILGADVDGACPPRPWVFMAGGRCQAPSGVTTCPVGDFRVVSQAVGSLGVVCQKTVRCPVTKGARWVRETLGQCRAPRGVATCPKGWAKTSGVNRNQGVACLAPLDILTRRPTPAPTAAPSMRRRVRDPSAKPTPRFVLPSPLYLSLLHPTAEEKISRHHLTPTPSPSPLSRVQALCRPHGPKKDRPAERARYPALRARDPALGDPLPPAPLDRLAVVGRHQHVSRARLCAEPPALAEPHALAAGRAARRHTHAAAHVERWQPCANHVALDAALGGAHHAALWVHL